MQIRFYLDPETGLPHIFDHGVTEDEVVEILATPEEDQPGKDGSRIALGQTSAGRYLRVIYVPDDDDVNSFFVVTAYELRGKSLKAFRRRRRRRGQ
jgi:Domain of unknown function (DUF4258)